MPEKSQAYSKKTAANRYVTLLFDRSKICPFLLRRGQTRQQTKSGGIQ